MTVCFLLFIQSKKTKIKVYHGLEEDLMYDITKKILFVTEFQINSIIHLVFNIKPCMITIKYILHILFPIHTHNNKNI